jgi:hypothetical protein
MRTLPGNAATTGKPSETRSGPTAITSWGLRHSRSGMLTGPYLSAISSRVITRHTLSQPLDRLDELTGG